MHMADALVSPAVGGILWAVSGGLLAFCARDLRKTPRDNLVPLMGVLGAFVFAVQMINFTIPGTGSSGHLGGGLLLAILLGPNPAFLVLASILTVQAFFFADGGLLTLGCNLFNLGFFPAFVAYPLLYRPIAGTSPDPARIWTASIIAAIAGLQLGAFGVVLETRLSGLSALPFQTFLLVMLPIHLAIGAVEGIATAAIVTFVIKARPTVFASSSEPGTLRPILPGLALAALLAGGAASWFASTHPDGLEWSLARITGNKEMIRPASEIHNQLAHLQERTAFLPDYGFRPAQHETTPAASETSAWPAVNAGTSLAGIVGGIVTLALAGIAGLALKAIPLRHKTAEQSRAGGEHP